MAIVLEIESNRLARPGANTLRAYLQVWDLAENDIVDSLSNSLVWNVSEGEKRF